MTEPITNLNDAFDLFFVGGTVRLRLKEWITRETLLDERLEKLKILIPENLTKTTTQDLSQYLPYDHAVKDNQSSAQHSYNSHISRFHPSDG